MSQETVTYRLGEIRAVLQRCLEREPGHGSDIKHALHCVKRLAEEADVNLDDKVAAEAGNMEIYNSPVAQAYRDCDRRWREEIMKFFPHLAVMSFAGPRATIRWLMDKVTVNEADAALAKLLQDIEASDMTDEEKSHARLTSIFPNLGKRLN